MDRDCRAATLEREGCPWHGRDHPLCGSPHRRGGPRVRGTACARENRGPLWRTRCESTPRENARQHRSFLDSHESRGRRRARGCSRGHSPRRTRHVHVEPERRKPALPPRASSPRARRALVRRERCGATVTPRRTRGPRTRRARGDRSKTSRRPLRNRHATHPRARSPMARSHATRGTRARENSGTVRLQNSPGLPERRPDCARR